MHESLLPVSGCYCLTPMNKIACFVNRTGEIGVFYCSPLKGNDIILKIFNGNIARLSNRSLMDYGEKFKKEDNSKSMKRKNLIQRFNMSLPELERLVEVIGIRDRNRC